MVRDFALERLLLMSFSPPVGGALVLERLLLMSFFPPVGRDLVLQRLLLSSLAPLWLEWPPPC